MCKKKIKNELEHIEKRFIFNCNRIVYHIFQEMFYFLQKKKNDIDYLNLLYRINLKKVKNKKINKKLI